MTRVFFAFWIHEATPFLGPHWGNLGVRYYGLSYLLGFLAAGWLLVRYARAGRSRLPESQVSDFMVAIVLGVLLGGRLGYFIFYRPGDVAGNPLVLFRVWEGGMASHGGFLGVTLAVAWFARTRHISFLHLGDLIASTAPVGLFLGRIANFLNGELWGKPTLVRWAVIFTSPESHGVPRHPSQLYEAALEGAVLFAYIQWRFWRSAVVARQPGRLAGEFLLGYAAMRAICELFREPDASLILGLSRGTFYSLFLVAGGLLLVAMARSRPPQNAR